MSYFEFPHTRTYDSDLGWLIRHMKTLIGDVESLEDWKADHEAEYQELLQTVNNFINNHEYAPEIQAQLQELMNSGNIVEIIYEAAAGEANNAIAELLGTPTTADWLQEVNGDFILLTNGSRIDLLIPGTDADYPTTNALSYIYAGLKDAENKLYEGKKRLNTYWEEYTENPQVLTLLHYSDIHNEVSSAERIYTWFKSLCLLSDDVICTGDLVANYFSNTFGLGTLMQNNTLARKTLLAIGNHDVWLQGGGNATKEAVYNKFFAPFITDWSVTYTAGNTYYYKDYDGKGIRLIVMDDLLSEGDMAAQLVWLESTLADARLSNLSVVIAKHYAGPGVTPIASPFTAFDRTNPGYGNAGISSRVQAFMDAGGDFICYLCGHTHYDYFGKLTEYPDQWFMCIDAAGFNVCNGWSDVMRVHGQRSEDLFNMVMLDKSSHTVKIFRVGCDYDRYLRHKNTLSFNWQTKEIYTN